MRDINVSLRVSSRLPLLLLYAASGAAALVYEVAWTRQLTLLMGHTVAAASTVLAAVMGGLALGSWLGARLVRSWSGAARGSRALVTLASLEIVIALAALALPVLLSAATPALAWAYDDGQAPIRFGLTRALLCALLVGVPATAMGATFPVAVTWYARVAADAGVLYAANTAGAAIGALATGFWLVPALGLRATTWVGVSLNILVAAGARWLATRPTAPERSTPLAQAGRGSGKGARAKDDGRHAARRPLVDMPPALAIAATAAAMSGCCAMIYQVVWTRLVALVIGPTTYAFATVVAAFIVGLAVGSAAGARVARRAARPLAWLGTTLLLGALAAAASGWYAATQLPLVVAQQVASTDAAFAPIVTRQVLGVLVLLLPLACALGASFSLAVAAAAGRSESLGDPAARVYVWNTLGAIAGALAGGFVLLPLMGLQGSLRAATALGWAAALVVWAVEARRAAGPSLARFWQTRGAALVSGAAVLVLLPAWDPYLLSGGAYKYASYIGVADFQEELHLWRMLYHRDGATATVSVRELAGQRSMAIDGKVDASNVGDMLTQRLLGLLPVLLHDKPQDVLVLGLGSGVTAGATLAPGTVRAADVVEISPEVVAASRFFARENGDVLQAPGVRLLVGDGRSHLAFTRRRYDVIVSEPSNPWMAGIAPLFTREFFTTVRDRLKPDGIVCQWAHTYDISRDDLRSIIRTFGSVFPQSTLWLVGDGDLLLIGTNGVSIDRHVDGLAARVNRGTTPKLLSGVGVAGPTAPFALLSLLAAGPAQMAQYGDGAAIQTDDQMDLEYSAPRAIYGRSNDDNASEIRQLGGGATSVPAARLAWQQASDTDLTAAGTMSLQADGYRAAFVRFEQAVRMNSRNAEALAGLFDAATGAGRPDDAREVLERVAAAEPSNAAVRTELSRLFAARGDLERAATLAAEAARLAPDDPLAGEQLASVFVDAGDAARLTSLSAHLVARFPARDRPLYFKAMALMLENLAPEAVATAREVVARAPGDVRNQNLLGVACATVGDRACAQAAFEAALAIEPRDPTTLVNVGVFHLASDPARAATAFQTALTADRTSVPARQGLAEARAALAAR